MIMYEEEVEVEEEMVEAEVEVVAVVVQVAVGVEEVAVGYMWGFHHPNPVPVGFLFYTLDIFCFCQQLWVRYYLYFMDVKNKAKRSEMSFFST